MNHVINDPLLEFFLIHSLQSLGKPLVFAVICDRFVVSAKFVFEEGPVFYSHEKVDGFHFCKKRVKLL